MAFKLIHIENNDINAVIMSVLIKRDLDLDIEITRYSEPTSFLEVIDETEFDMIFSDFDMPIMDGITFFFELNELKIDKPKYIVTAVPLEEFNFDMSLICNGIIEKPVRIEVLKEIFAGVPKKNNAALSNQLNPIKKSPFLHLYNVFFKK